jgi:fructokinase
MSELTEPLRRNAQDIAARIEALPETGARRLAAIAGPPGSGKSTLAEAVVAELRDRGHDAVLMPMDGFHLDNRLLEPRGLLARKGAPETFDFGGFITAIRRVREEPSVSLPVFDRSREIAVAAAEEIRPETRIVVVEGNYLVLDEDPWRALRAFWDFTVFLDVPIAELGRRLIDRWLSYGFDAEAAASRARGNDLANAARIKRSVSLVDLVIEN